MKSDHTSHPASANRPVFGQSGVLPDGDTATQPADQVIGSDNAGSALLAIPPLTEADLRLMRIFRAVVEAGGLAAAEMALGMDRSSISRHLNALETRLGARLCFRGPGGFELTDFGRATWRAAVSAYDTLDMIRHELNVARNIMTGELHVGIADNCLTNTRSAFVEALTRFRELAPAVTVYLSIYLPDDLLARLADRHLQLGITGISRGVTGTTLGNETLLCEPLFTEEFRLYVRARERKPAPTLDELAMQGYELVVRARDAHTRRLVERVGIDRHGISVGLEAVATLIASGRYAGFLPTHYVDALSAVHPFVAVREAEELAYEAVFALVFVKDRHLAPVTELFMRTLLDTHRQDAESNPQRP